MLAFGVFDNELAAPDLRENLEALGEDIAQDLLEGDTVLVNFDDDLEKAYRLFNARDLALIPVVDEYDENKVIGVLRRADLMIYYNRQLLETLRR